MAMPQIYPKPNDAQWRQLAADYLEGKISRRAIAQIYGHHPETIGRWLREESGDRVEIKIIKESNIDQRQIRILEAEQYILEAVMKECKAIPGLKIPLIEVPKAKGKEEVAILDLSDIHNGLQGKYFNFSIIQEEMATLQKKLFKIVRIQQADHPIKRLCIFSLADILSNERVGQQMELQELEATVLPQIFDMALPLLSGLLINCLQVFEEVEYYGVRGNHGGLGKMWAGTTNFDSVVHKVLELALQNYPRIKFNVEIESFYQLVNVMGRGHLILHGDKIPASLGIPYYGIERRVGRWNVSIPWIEGIRARFEVVPETTPRDFEFVHMGHFHSAGFTQLSGKPTYVNGCWPFAIEWPLQTMGLAGPPEQWLIFQSDRGISAEYRIRLVE